ncbi:MAG TPA: DNA-3-methyladenine glycosylase [Spirochaetia bacterium]|nr:DNA-3-methyladenine glycosylase [Spirochaetia bacterium]
MMKIRLPYQPPYAWDRLIAFLAAREIPSIETVTPECYSRTIRTEDAVSRIVVRNDESRNCLVVSIDPEPKGETDKILSRVRSMFDLDVDPNAVHALLTQDELIAPFVHARPGLRIPGIWDRFEFLIRAVLGQQVSVRSATTTAARLVQLAGSRVSESADRESHLFPEPEQIASMDLLQLAVPGSRRRTIAVLAESIASGSLDLDDRDGRVQGLLSLPGIGPWTVEYALMRAFNEADAFPSGDLVLKKALRSDSDAPLPTSRQVEERAEAWRPWRAYATMYLWDSLLS